MKIAFVQSQPYIKLGSTVISGVLKKRGFTNIEMFIYKFDEHSFYDKLVSYGPDIVLSGFYLGDMASDLAIINNIKRKLPEVLVIVGGPYFMLDIDIIKTADIDVIVRGDGERSIVKIFDRLQNGKSLDGITGVTYKNKDGKVIISDGFDIINDLEELPPGDYDLYYQKYNQLAMASTKSFIINRGCPFSCSFCGPAYLDSNCEIKYKAFRKNKNYGRIFEEIKYVKDMYGVSWVHFQDGTFNASKKDMMDFLQLYMEERMPPFLCNVRAENVDEQMVKLLKKAGCERITMGIQSGVERIKKIAGRQTSNEKIINVINLFKRYGIRVGVDIIIGWPGETINDIWETVYFLRKLQPEYVSVNRLILFPNTEISKYAYENGYIPSLPSTNDMYVWEVNKNSEVVYLKHSAEVKNMVKLFEYAVFHPRLEEIIRLLAKMPDNRFFTILKDYRSFKRSLKYDNTTQSKLKRCLNFIWVGSVNQTV